MDPRHIIRLSATELVRHLMSNELTSVQVTEAFLARLDELATTTRPMAVRMDMDARRQASDSDARRKAGKLLSPMDGVPMTVKESIDIAGKPSTLGLPSRRRHKADADAVVVQQLRGLGAVFLGKTNVSQGLLFHECSNPLYGTTTNPHATTRTPGGSSGGEAAAIASYGSPMGIGTDIGGSIRVPAHFTGICGLKPTVDRWSNMGSNGVSPGQEIVRGQMGPMARTVDDIMLLMQAVSPERASRPWDKGRDGFVMGEGSGVVVLESLEHARKRGAKIYAEILGYGLAGDAYHLTAPAEDGSGGFRAMRGALRDAGLNADQIDYVNAHGTSTPKGDEIELLAVKRIFGDQAYKLSMSSTKSAIGHLLGAAGAVEAIYSMLALRDQVAPPTLNLDDPSEGCDIDLVPHKAKQRKIRYALSNSFGFGGTNASLVIGPAP